MEVEGVVVAGEGGQDTECVHVCDGPGKIKEMEGKGRGEQESVEGVKGLALYRP